MKRAELVIGTGGGGGHNHTVSVVEDKTEFADRTLKQFKCAVYSHYKEN